MKDREGARAERPAERAALDLLRQGLQPEFGSWSLPGMLHASTIRSGADKGILRAINPPVLPRGYRLIRAEDIPGHNNIKSFGAQVPIFANSAISYRGEAVGLIVGPDPALADELAAATEVQIDEDEPFLLWESFSSSQVVAKRIAVQGDPEAAFSRAASVLKGSYRNRSIEHFYSEPMGALAAWDYDKMAVVCASQWPYHVRDSVAIALGSSPDDVVMYPAKLGMHLDGKMWFPSLLACQASVAARACGVPVRIFYTRKEDFLFSPKRARSQIGIRSALGSNGRVEALDIRIVVNVGAYGPLAEEILNQAMLAASGIYACQNIRVEGYAVVTNSLPLGALGGLGSSHSYFAIESHMNRVAQSLGENPAEWKATHLLKKGMRLFGSDPVTEEAPYARMVSRLETLSDYRRKYASYELVRKRDGGSGGTVRGISLALAGESGVFFVGAEGSNTYSLEATLDKDSSLELRSSAAVEGPDITSIWKMSASEILGIEPERVRIAPAHTGLAPNSGPVTMSRGVTVVNKLVERCCRAIQKKRFREALPIHARSVVRVSSHARWDQGVLVGTPFEATAWGASVVEVELDPVTGSVRPTGVWMVVDAGRVLRPERARGTLRSSIVDALGMCMTETFDPVSADADEAYPRTLSPQLSDLPPIVVDLIDPDSRNSPKGVEDLPFDTIPAAFLSAIAQASGGEPDALPLSASEILRMLEAR